MFVLLAAAATASDLADVTIGQPIAHLRPAADIELFGLPARRDVAHCTHETDDGKVDRVTGVVVRFRWTTPDVAAMVGESFAMVSADPGRASLEALTVIGPALGAEGWKSGSSPWIGRDVARFQYARGGESLVALHAHTNAATWEVHLSVSGEEREICPPFPPEETWRDLREVEELHRAAGFAYRGPDDDGTIARTVRQWRREGHSVTEIASLSRYGHAEGLTFEQALRAGLRADRTRLLPQEVERSWGRARVGLGECQQELHLASMRGLAAMVVGGTERTYPKRVTDDPGIPLTEETTAVKDLALYLDVDAAGRLLAVRPVVPHRPGHADTDEAMATYWACATRNLSVLTFEPGPGPRTGRLDLRVSGSGSFKPLDH